MIYFTDWRLDATGDIIARQYDNQSRTITITGALPEGWTWELLVRAGDAYDEWPMTAQDGGIGCTLTAEMLAVSGYYTLQLRGKQGEMVRHTNTIRVFVPESLSGDAQWPELPTAFSDAVDRAEDAADRAENAATHGPKISDTNTWMLWDADEGDYIDTMVDASGAPGPDGKPGKDGITPTIGDNGNWFIGATDTGKPSKGEDGKDGTNGSNGADGYSPTVSVNKSGKITTITVVDKHGETISTVEDGKDGTTPDIKIGTVTTLPAGSQATAEMTGTATEPTLNLGIPKGDKGDSGSGSDVSLGLTSATVGQIVKIAAVDDNGVPTAWEPTNINWTFAGSVTSESAGDSVEITGLDAKHVMVSLWAACDDSNNKTYSITFNDTVRFVQQSSLPHSGEKHFWAIQFNLFSSGADSYIQLVVRGGESNASNKSNDVVSTFYNTTASGTAWAKVPFAAITSIKFACANGTLSKDSTMSVWYK